MMWELIFAVVTSGGLSSALTWIVSKRKRNNDFITDLQNSINLLSDNYTKTLDELIVVKKQNNDLMIQVSKIEVIKKQNNDLIILVSQLENELAKLKEENSSLIKKMNEFISQLEPEMAKLKEENSTLIKKMNELKRMLSKQ